MMKPALLFLAISALLGVTAQAQLITPKEVPSAAGVPTVVGLLMRDKESPSGFCVVPLSVYDGGKWNAGLLEVERGKDPISLKDKAFSEMLMKQTFYCPCDPAVRFAPTSPGRHEAGVDEDGFALRGSLSGNVGQNDTGLIMVSQPSGWPAPVNVGTKLDVQRLTPLLDRSAEQATKSARVGIDIRKYDKAQMKLTLQFNLEKNRRSYWVHLFRPISSQAAPPRPSFAPPDFPTWSLDFYAVVEETADNAYTVVWQEACLNCDLLWHYDLIPVGLCDVNGDGVAEMVLLHKASEWESSGYSMFEMIGTGFQKVESVRVLP